MRMSELDVGDVICTRNPTGLAAFFIRLGAALRDRPNITNHVIVVHHWDGKKRCWMGIEARSEGVGWIELTDKVLRQPYVVSNFMQPRTEGQRYLIAKGSEMMLGVAYDWAGIVMDAAESMGVEVPSNWTIDPPTAVVCSSLADWCYDYAGAKSPGGQFDRTVTPGDWAQFIYEKRWLT